MKRPWHAWAAFAACSLLLVAALAWLTGKVLALDRSEAEARAQAALEENSRLALWRMDSLMTALIVRESGQPASNYSAFLPASHTAAGPQPSRVVPSPLLVERSPYVRIHLEIDADGHVRSPEVPDAEHRKLAIPRFLDEEMARQAATLLSQSRKLLEPRSVAARLPDSPTAPTNSLASNDSQEITQQQVVSQSERNFNEFAVRTQLLNTAQNPNPYTRGGPPQKIDLRPDSDRSMGPMTALWLGEELFLARKSDVKGRLTLQACWLDWPAIRQDLLAAAHDLLPSAQLVPNSEPDAKEEPRLLATLPVRLVVPTIPLLDTDGLSPMRLALAVAWGSVACVIAASAFLLRGVVALNERRAAFVSAVTHELRTPLTTFRMYSEMLAEDMVPGESDRKCYLETLRSEADRLVHLVENVLAYARLERGAVTSRLREVAIDDLLDEVSPRLEDRARQCGMSLTIESGDLGTAPVLTDPAAVGQILFNLVDNACKYGVSSEGIRLAAERNGNRIALTVEDRGPGVAAIVRRRLFRPFQKSSSEAATSAPGVGLGLALCRRLAREIGGDLRLDGTQGTGARFVLDLGTSLR